MAAWAAGPRTAALAERVVQLTRQRTVGRAGVAWISDGWDAYEATITETYWDRVPMNGHGRSWTVLRPAPGVRLTQAVKHRRRRRLVAVEVRATLGAMAAQPYAAHNERHNGVLRDRLACLTCKTHAFAKDVTLWDVAVGMALFEHNWLRPHPALRLPLAIPDHGRRYQRRTPAMALHLADHPWTWAEFLMHPLPHQPRG